MNIELTKIQLELVNKAVDILFDIENDTVLDELWISDQEPQLSRNQLMTIRKETNKKINELLELQALKLQLNRLT